MVSAAIYLLEVIAFPLLGALGLSYFTTREATSHVRRLGSPMAVESDLHNENLDPSIHTLTFWLLFSLYFNIIYLTVNLGLVEKTLFNSPYIYAASIAAFLIALFFAFSYVFRFNDRKYAVIGVTYSILGTVVIATSVQFGYGRWVAEGASASSAASAYTLAGGGQNLVIPVVLAGCAWILTLVAFLLDLGVGFEHLPFRFTGNRAYNTLILTLMLGYLGVTLAILHPLLSLI